MFFTPEIPPYVENIGKIILIFNFIKGMGEYD